MELITHDSGEKFGQHRYMGSSKKIYFLKEFFRHSHIVNLGFTCNSEIHIMSNSIFLYYMDIFDTSVQNMKSYNYVDSLLRYYATMTLQNGTKSLM